MTGTLRRWWWAVPALLLLAGLARVRFDTDVLNLLPDSVPAVRGLQLYQRHFTNSRELIATIRAPDAESAETAARLLAEAVRRQTNLVTAAVWQPPWMDHPEQMAEFIAYLWLNQPPARFIELTNRLATGQLPGVAREAREQLATTMSPTDIARLSYDPFGFTRLPADVTGGGLFESPLEGFASVDGTFRAVFIESATELGDYRKCSAWLAKVKATVQQAAAVPEWPAGAVVRYTGAPEYVAEIATSMASDMQFTVLTTLALIVALFWWAHRSWRPLALLVVMLGLVLAGALAAGGWIFGTLNTVSLGFGAILLGLAVDCGLVVYQEAAAAPHLSAAELRHELVPSVLWSALTTAAAFLLLNFAGLPGLSQLGTIVGIGVLLAPLVMMFLFLPLALRWLRKRPAPEPPVSLPAPSLAPWRLASLVVLALAALSLSRAWPPVDRGNSPIEPKHSAAQLALDELRSAINRLGDPLLVVVEGESDGEVASRLSQLKQHLTNAQAQGQQFKPLLPDAVWPHREWLVANTPAAKELAARSGEFARVAATTGFTPQATELTANVLRALGNPPAGETAWPTNAACRWLLQRATAHTADRWLAAGAVYAAPNSAPPPRLADAVNPSLPGVWVTGWPLLGGSLFQHVERRVTWLVLVIVAVVGLCLWLAFRRWLEVVVSFAALGFLLLVLQAALGLIGVSWNLMSLASLPLLLGAGVDYIIHVQVALRRHHGDVRAMRRVVGRAILLCAATNVDGFGSNMLSNNPGLASLGLVCAIGITVAYVTAVFFVPAWWTLCSEGAAASANSTAHLARPSAAYGPRVWRLGLFVVRCVSRSLCQVLGQMLALGYRWFRPQRFGILVENLLPVLGKDPVAARRAARSLMANFAVKITDLLRHEGGSSREIAVTHWSGYEILTAALARGQGVLLVTPHLGNWEFGGCLLAQKGVRLLVLTQAEPGAGFTEMRQQARARWGIETLVVGQDAFAFVEIIKRLQEGAVVALLVDRPPPPSGVTIEFFGRPFQASIAPAELARASGCAVVPVYVVAEGGGYSAHVLPEVVYDRRALGNREARRQFAGEILRAFEPVVRQYADQWYHFVPMWK